MSYLLIFVLIAASSCARKTYIRSPSSHQSKYEAFKSGMIIKLREPVIGARKEETIFEDKKCSIAKYCVFEIGNDPHRRLTIRGEFTVDSVNEEEDRLVLRTKDQEKIQLDCGLKYSLKKISLKNDKYCEGLMKEYTIYTFPEFMQTIVDMEINYLEP